MAYLQTDGAQVFSRWHHDGMTGYRKRPRDPAQLAIASGNAREDEQPKKANRRNKRTKRPKSLPGGATG